MRILMLGNSFIFYNNMPETLAALTGAEVVQHTRGGARLAEQLNPDTKMGSMTLSALRDEKWDYVILQEMSSGPISSKKSFLSSAAGLCELIRGNGAVPVFYATWAYKRNGGKMRSMPYSYDDMYESLTAAYHEAAEANGALVADVGKQFYKLADTMELYAEDGIHPSEIGSYIAATSIADVCLKSMKMSVYEALRLRHSIRSYTGEPIPEEKLNMILQAGLMSESGHNRKSYELIVVRDHDALQEMSACRVGCAKMLAQAAAAIVVIGDAELSDTWIEDGAVIMANMHLTADDLGVGSCWVQGRARNAVNGETTEDFLRKLLNFPEKYRLEAILALGMPAEKKPKRNPEELPTEKIHYGKF